MADPTTDAATEEEPDPEEVMRQRAFLGVLVLAAVVGVIASLVAWGFLEAIHQLQDLAYQNLPDALGFDDTPDWWSLPLLLIASFPVAWAVAKAPGGGGHIPVRGLNPAPTQPNALIGVLVAALAGISLGIVLGPEAPLIALGGGIGYLVIQRIRSDAPETAQTLIATAGVFSAISFLFGSPLIAAVILVEAAGLDRRRLTLVLIPGMLAAGIGSLISTGMGSWTGVDSSAIAIDPLQLEAFPRPELDDFLWTVPLAAVVAIGTKLIFSVGHRVEPPALKRPFVVLPAVAVAIALLATGFALITGKGADMVLFSGQETIDPLVEHAPGWSVGVVLLLIAAKGLGYGLALGSFRGGPVFPGLFLGAAAGVLAAKLPGFDLTPAVAVGLGAATVAVLRLPLSAVVLAVVLTESAGLGTGALIIVGVVVSYLISNVIDPPPKEPAAPAPAPAPAPG